MKKITLEEWKTFVASNADSSYGMAMCLAMLLMWEKGVKTEEEATAFLIGQHLGLSGMQGETAVSLVLQRDASDWLDKTMQAVMRGDKI